jgi:hypothetical protein
MNNSERSFEPENITTDSKESAFDQNIVPIGDILLGIVLLLMSLAIIIISIKMPRPAGWGQAPGLFPLVCGLALLCMGLILFLKAFKKVTLNSLIQNSKTQATNLFQAKRMFIVIGGIFFYVSVLIPLLHYMAATLIYLLFTVWYFWRGKVYWILLISIGGTTFLSLTFKYFFEIILP